MALFTNLMNSVDSIVWCIAFIGASSAFIESSLAQALISRFPLYPEGSFED